MFAAFVLLWWHSSLEVRAALVGIYFVVGTVATTSVLVLSRLDKVVSRRVP